MGEGVLRKLAKAFNDPETVFWTLVSMPVIMLVTIAFLAGLLVGERNEQTKAIEAKASQWTVNASTGERSFVYGAKP